MPGKEVHQGLLLQSRGQLFAGDFAIPALPDLVAFLDQIKPVFLLRRDFLGGVDGDDGAANASRQAVAFRRNAQVDPIAFLDLPVQRRADQGTVGGVCAHHDLKAVTLGTQHAANPGAPGRNFGLETSRAEDREHRA